MCDRDAEINRLNRKIAQLDFVRERLLPFIGLVIVIVILATR